MRGLPWGVAALGVLLAVLGFTLGGGEDGDWRAKLADAQRRAAAAAKNVSAARKQQEAAVGKLTDRLREATDERDEAQRARDAAISERDTAREDLERARTAAQRSADDQENARVAWQREKVAIERQLREARESTAQNDGASADALAALKAERDRLTQQIEATRRQYALKNDLLAKRIAELEGLPHPVDPETDFARVARILEPADKRLMRYVTKSEIDLATAWLTANADGSARSLVKVVFKNFRARFIIDGKKNTAYYTPFTAVLKAGDHRFTLDSPNWPYWETTVTVKAGKLHLVRPDRLGAPRAPR